MFAFIFTTAAAAGDISTDRPSAGTSALTVGNGVFQFETGVQADMAGGTAFSLPTLFRYGVGENLEVRADSGMLSIADGSTAFGGLGAGGKYTVSTTDAVALGIVAGSSIPLDGGDASPYALLLADFAAGLWANAGWTGGSTLYYAAGYGFGLPADGFSAFVETAGSLALEASAWNGTVQAGTVWASGNCEADLYVQTSLDGASGSMAAAGVSYRFGAD